MKTYLSNEKRRGKNPAQKKKAKQTAHLELHDLLETIARLAHPAHLLIERPHAPTYTLRRARRDRDLARERRRLRVELIDAGKKRLQAGEGVLDRLVIAEERGERVGQLGLFGLERGERGEDLRERRQRQRGRPLLERLRLLGLLLGGWGKRRRWWW